jgi:hypothetical protein
MKIINKVIRWIKSLRYEGISRKEHELKMEKRSPLGSNRGEDSKGTMRRHRNQGDAVR